MINGLGLLGALTPPDAAQPQPAPADDPAVFAAALVAALGLQQPVQVTVTPPHPVAEGAEQVEEDEQAAEGEAAPVASAPVEGEGEDETAAPVVARVTPDPEVLEESKAFDRIPGAGVPQPRGLASAKAKAAKQHDGDTRASREASVTNDQAETGTAATASIALTTESTSGSPTPLKDVAPAARPASAPVVEDAAAVTPEPARDSEHAVEANPAARKASKEAPKVREEPASRDAALPAVTAPVVQPTAAPPQPPPPSRPVLAGESGAVTSDEALPRAPMVPPTSDPVSGPYGGKVPPQSVQERTARAMAENVRVGRQLAELLGEETITEFKLELGRPHSVNSTPAEGTRLDDGAPAPRPAAPVGENADVIAGAILPRDDLAPRSPRKAVQGTLAREAIEPVIARPFARESITITPVTSRPEIVRMVANAGLATSPNLAQTEGTPAVAKAPAPSVMPSLPDVRQELPGARSQGRSGPSEDRDRPVVRESGTSADASPSSLAAANNQPANKPAEAPENGRASREARNLPSHESTEHKAAGSADRVTLQVADDEGRQTRIRVSVTGSQIRAVITPPDGTSARQLEQRMDQLHETLVRQGFTDPKVVVRTAPELASDAAAVAGATSGNQERNTVPAGRDQPAGDQRQGRGQREQDRGDGHRHPQGHSRERDPRDRRR